MILQVFTIYFKQQIYFNKHFFFSSFHIFTNIIFSQRHEFEAIYHETVGYRLKLRELTDGGLYTCHYISDQHNEYDIHFNVEIDRELKMSRGAGFVKIMNNNNNNKNAIDVTDTDATATAPFGVNQFLTTAIRKPHLITTKQSSHSSNIVASNSMVRRTTTGDGQSSIQKRHINSFDTSTTIITTSPTSSIPVLYSNKQHSTLSDLELTTANAAATIQTTIVPFTADDSYPMILPYKRGKSHG